MAEYAEKEAAAERYEEQAKSAREMTGWERVTHHLPDEIEALGKVVATLTERLSPFLREADVPTLAEATPVPAGAPGIVHAEEQIDRIRDLRRRVGAILDRLDI